MRQNASGSRSATSCCRFTAFRDPAANANTVAVLIEAPDLDSLQAALATPEAKVTEEHDGVHVDAIRLFLDA